MNDDVCPHRWQLQLGSVQRLMRILSDWDIRPVAELTGSSTDSRRRRHTWFGWEFSPGQSLLEPQRAAQSSACLSAGQERHQVTENTFSYKEDSGRRMIFWYIFHTAEIQKYLSLYWGSFKPCIISSGLCELYTDMSPSSGQSQCFRVLFVPIRERQNLQRHSIGNWESWRRSQQTTWRRIKEHVGGALSRLLPWSHTLHKIEGDCWVC